MTRRLGGSLGRICNMLDINRSSLFYKVKKYNKEVRPRLVELAKEKGRYGYRRLHILLKREGCNINHKKVYRLYKQEGLSLRSKTGKKRAVLRRKEQIEANRQNEVWSIDFVSDRLNNGRRFRALTIVDRYSRECPHIEVDSSLTGYRVARVLNNLKEQGKKPEIITLDNGPEFISKALDQLAYANGVKLSHIRPGKPAENGHIESFNGKLREECLSMNYFTTMQEARRIIEDWRKEYNEQRPHSGLGGLTPMEFLKKEKIGQKAEVNSVK